MDVSIASDALERFNRLPKAIYRDLEIIWEPSMIKGTHLGTVKLASGRVQPFALLLRSEGDRLVIRCVSPIGLVDPENKIEEIMENILMRKVRVGAIIGHDEGTYDLTVEEDVLLGDHRKYDEIRVALLLKRVAEQADALEQIHLPSLDQPLDRFESDLKKEGRADRD